MARVDRDRSCGVQLSVMSVQQNNGLATQFVEQRLSLFQIGGIEVFGKP